MLGLAPKKELGFFEEIENEYFTLSYKKY